MTRLFGEYPFWLVLRGNQTGETAILWVPTTDPSTSAKLHELRGGGLFQIKKCFTDWFEHFLKATRFPPVETLEATDLMDDIGFLPT